LSGNCLPVSYETEELISPQKIWACSRRLRALSWSLQTYLECPCRRNRHFCTSWIQISRLAPHSEHEPYSIREGEGIGDNLRALLSRASWPVSRDESITSLSPLMGKAMKITVATTLLPPSKVSRSPGVNQSKAFSFLWRCSPVGLITPSQHGW
jgi:hypothetical protein